MSQQERDIGQVANKIFETVDNSALKMLPSGKIQEYLTGKQKRLYQGALNQLQEQGLLKPEIGAGDTFYLIP